MKSHFYGKSQTRRRTYANDRPLLQLFNRANYRRLVTEVSVGIAISLALFQPLWTSWSTGRTIPYAVAGYIPYSDASFWFNGALDLLLHGKVHSLGATRIVNESFVALLLFLSQLNLQRALILRTALIALAFFLFLRELLHRFGLACAATTGIAMIAFIGTFTPTMMTESTAAFLGTLGATLLIIGTDEARLQLFSAGLFLVVLALEARPGPFFVLPLLIVWAGRCFRQTNKSAFRPMLQSAASVAFGFGVSFLLQRLYTMPGTIPFTNFAYTLYGLAKGGKDWSVVVTNYGHLPASNIVMKRAITLIRQNPLPMVHGMWTFVSKWMVDQFIYINPYFWRWRARHSYTRWYRAPFVICELIELVYVVRPGRAKVEELCALSFVGCLLSSSVTFSDRYLYRSFASTNAIQALLAGLGARAAFRAVRRRASSRRQHWSSAWLAIYLGGSITVSLIFAPLMTAIVGEGGCHHGWAVSQCSESKVPLIFDLGRSSPFLRIGRPAGRTFVPSVAENRFLQNRSFNNYVNRNVATQFATLGRGDLLVLVYDLGGSHVGVDSPVFLIVRDIRKAVAPALYRACAQREDVPTKWGGVRLFTAEHIEPLDPR